MSIGIRNRPDTLSQPPPSQPTAPTVPLPSQTISALAPIVLGAEVFDQFAAADRALVERSFAPVMLSMTQPARDGQAKAIADHVAAFEGLLEQLSPPDTSRPLQNAFDLKAERKLQVRAQALALRGAMLSVHQSTLPSAQVSKACTHVWLLAAKSMQQLVAKPADASRKPTLPKLASALRTLQSKDEDAPLNQEELDAQVLPIIGEVPQHPDMDIDQLVEWTLSTLAQDTETELREFINEMRGSQRERAALAQLKQAQSEAKARVQRELQEEFAALSADGTLGKGVTFEAYSAWRQVTWSSPTQNHDGSWTLPAPSLAEPRPPAVPPSLMTDTNEEPAVAPEREASLEASFGLPPELVVELKRLFQAIPIQEKLASRDNGQPTAYTFAEWLGLIGLKQPIHNAGEAVANVKLVNAYASELTKRLDIGVQQASGRLVQHVDQQLAEVKKLLDEAKAALSSDFEGLRQEEISQQYRARVEAKLEKLAPLLLDLKQSYVTDGDRATILSALDRFGEAFRQPYSYPATEIQYEVPTGPNGETLYQLPPDILTLLGNQPTATALDPKFAATNAKFTTSSTFNVGPLPMPLTPAGELPFIAQIYRQGAGFDSFGAMHADWQKKCAEALEEGRSQQEGARLYGAGEAVYETAPSTSAVTTLALKLAGDCRVSDERLCATLRNGLKEWLKSNPSHSRRNEMEALQREEDTSLLDAAGRLFLSPDFQEGGAAYAITLAMVGGRDTREQDRLSTLLCGTTPKVLDAMERNLIDRGVLPDPNALAAARRQALRLEAGRVSYEAKPQRAKAGYDSVGSMSELDAQINKTTTKLDGLADLGTMQSMRLQLLMDRRSKFFETLSNVMKKVAGTRDSIIQNMKA